MMTMTTAMTSVVGWCGGYSRVHYSTVQYSTVQYYNGFFAGQLNYLAHGYFIIKNTPRFLLITIATPYILVKRGSLFSCKFQRLVLSQYKCVCCYILVASPPVVQTGTISLEDVFVMNTIMTNDDTSSSSCCCCC